VYRKGKGPKVSEEGGKATAAALEF